MKTNKLFAILLIGMVAATALVYAAPEVLTLTGGRVLGQLPAGTPTGTVKNPVWVYKSGVDQLGRSDKDVWHYTGTRCEEFAQGPRFIAYTQACYTPSYLTHGMYRGAAAYYGAKFSCAKPQVLQCMGKTCPNSVCKAPGRMVSKK